MSVQCPDGHWSETEDWCDECGSAIDLGAPEVVAAAGSPQPSPPSAPPPSPPPFGGGLPGGSSASGGVDCPVCSTARIGDDRYCEVCGYDFVTATGPAPAAAVPVEARSPATALPAPTPAPTPVAPMPVAPMPSQEPSGWTVEVVADRAFYDRGEDDDVPFPPTVVTRVVELGGVRSIVGRQSRSRGYFPEIDLSSVPEDRGVSRTHAIFDHPADGSLTITDLGSANGTWVDDDVRPLARGVAVVLREGARVYLGSWTRITVRRTGR